MSIIYPLAHKGLLGKGSILFDRFDSSGNPTGYIHLGNCSKGEHEIKVEKAELYQSINATPALIQTAAKKVTSTLSITGTDFSPEHLALVMASSAKSTLAVAATAVVAETLASATVSKKGKFFPLANRNIDLGTLTLTQTPGSGSAVTLVQGTDYIVYDAVAGLVYFPATSAVVDTEAVVAAYTPKVASYDQVAPSTVPLIAGRLRFVGDPSDGPRLDAEFWKVNLAPNGKIGLIADDYGNWELEADILSDAANHPGSPYGIYTEYN